MSFTLSEIVPWGRSYDEYVAMFALSASDLRKSILGCGDGPASFNSVLSGKGGRVVSVDPLYSLEKEQIQRRIDETYDTVLEETRKNWDEFVWDHIKSVDELGEIRMSAMKAFLADYEKGKQEKRYVSGELPALPFADNAFDLALCSHFLFLYSEHLSREFHLQSIIELCRVAGSVRIFPVLELGAVRSRHLDAVMDELKTAGYKVELRKVPYEFQKGGNEMLVIGG